MVFHCNIPGCAAAVPQDTEHILLYCDGLRERRTRLIDDLKSIFADEQDAVKLWRDFTIRTQEDDAMLLRWLLFPSAVGQVDPVKDVGLTPVADSKRVDLLCDERLADFACDAWRACRDAMPTAVKLLARKLLPEAYTPDPLRGPDLDNVDLDDLGDSEIVDGLSFGDSPDASAS